MKRKLISLLIAVLLLTAILPNYIYADDDGDDDDDEEVTAEAIVDAYGYDNYEQMTDEATTTVKGRNDVSITKRVSSTFSFGAAAGAAIGSVLIFPVVIVHTMISILTSYGSKDGFQWFTIESVVFNKVPFLDANFVVESPDNKIESTIKNSVLTWYYLIRIIAVAISLLVLMYIGIRMAISTIAEDKAKYKKMIGDWLFSFGLIFLLHYFIVIVLYFCEALVGLFGSIEIKGFEGSLYTQIRNISNKVNGWSFVGILALYIVLVFYEIKFFIIYLKRLLTIGFLIVISPLITITYSIDRAGDGKAQAFDEWMKEFLMFCFTQPLHAGLYVVFINTAYEIFQVAPLLAVLFFAGLSRAEKMVRNLFGMKGRAAHGALGDTFKFSHGKNK